MCMYIQQGMRKQTERTFKMGEKKESKLQHIMKISWESEKMPGWEDTLSMIVEATRKEFKLSNKEATQRVAVLNALENDTPILEDDFSM